MLAQLFHYLQIIYKNLIHIPGKNIAQDILAAEYFSIPNFSKNSKVLFEFPTFEKTQKYFFNS